MSNDTKPETTSNITGVSIDEYGSSSSPMKDVVRCAVEDTAAIQKGLLALANGKTKVVRVAGVLSASEANHVANTIKDGTISEQYQHIEGIWKIGYAYAEIRSQDDAKAYLSWGKRIAPTLEGLFGLDPTERVRNLLAMNWPGGLESVRKKGIVFPNGILRQQRAGWSGERAHIDFPPQAICSEVSDSRWMQWGTVLFADVPERGGALQIWTDRAYSEEDWDEIRRHGGERLRVERLGVPTIKISVKPGELVIFPTYFAHSVSPIQSGVRTSFGLFALVTRPEYPILVWT